MIHVTMDNPTDETVQCSPTTMTLEGYVGNLPGYVSTVPDNMPLTQIHLPNPWVLYLYDKQTFKKMASRPTFQAKPYREICTMRTVNDLVFIMQLMEAPSENTMKIDAGSTLMSTRHQI